MKKVLFFGILVVVLAITGVAGIILYHKYIRGALPAFKNPSKDIAELIEKAAKEPQNLTGMPLTIPAGFSISIFAKNLPGARVMAQDRFGNFWVSQTGKGKISFLEVAEGKVVRVAEMLKGLKSPHGLAFDPENGTMLYIAEEDKISRLPTYSDGHLEKVIDLPSGGRHFTRTLGFGPDNKLYVSIGSTCNVCHEEDPRNAKIFSLNRDGSDFKEFARGLRNAVFFTWSYVDGKMWATEMGRDGLGDNLPPDEINIVEQDKNYGWPTCYGKNIHDTEFDKNTYIRNPCMDPFEMPSVVDLPAHSAPLGLAFVPEEGWPEEYWYNLLVAYHGSWNRTQPTGYKVARIKLDAKGAYLGTEDFITGWLTADNEALGRPVDILTVPGGIAYISDDKAGVIYKLSYLRNEEPGDASDKSSLIRLDNPLSGSIVKNPLTVSGEARGYWFFEASFPVKLLDGNGKLLVVLPAQAQEEWMTENFVPFRVTLEFETPETETGTLVLERDNPSGLPEHADELRVPIRFR
ncbi:MAG: PQQ-dependent sugar dehydrogenase [bacterium]|nr:PQQ-dependent sugar dehydrogenase [bacterium]